MDKEFKIWLQDKFGSQQGSKYSIPLEVSFTFDKKSLIQVL